MDLTKNAELLPPCSPLCESSFLSDGNRTLICGTIAVSLFPSLHADSSCLFMDVFSPAIPAKDVPARSEKWLRPLRSSDRDGIRFAAPELTYRKSSAAAASA